MLPSGLSTGASLCRGVYQAAQPGFQGRCTAPLLLDKRDGKIVSNESSEIVRLLNSLQAPGSTGVNLRPAELESQLEHLNATIHDQVWHCSHAIGRVHFVDYQHLAVTQSQLLWSGQQWSVQVRLLHVPVCI